VVSTEDDLKRMARFSLRVRITAFVLLTLSLVANAFGMPGAIGLAFLGAFFGAEGGRLKGWVDGYREARSEMRAE
jgi:hypothetical protein